MGELSIYSEDEIESLVRKLPTLRKRKNARASLRTQTNKILDEMILVHLDTLREMRSESDSLKRGVYAEISRLERMKHYVR